MDEKKALLVVSFGTSHHDTREKTIDQIEAYLAGAFPDRRVYRAWTSGMIIRKLRQEGVEIDTVPAALERMLADGVTDVVVQPTHLLNGVENDAMIREAEAVRGRFQSLRIGAPLLTSHEDLEQMARILTEMFPQLLEEEAVLFMGHGTEHYANAVYAALDYRFKDMGRDRFYMATVEGYPTLENALRQMQARKGLKRVYLVPFMIVAGDHAKNDMAGDEPDSWKNVVAQAGYEPRCICRGMGEVEEVWKLLADHAREAEARQDVPLRGKLTGVGVGPGDPELLTLKALRRIQSCDLLILPDSDRGSCVAYQIVRRAIPEIEDKTTVCLVMPMTKDKDRLEKSHREGTQKVAEVLDAGKDAAFLTLGDPTVYATSMYIHQRIAGMGYRTSIVSGVPSFCAAAAKLGVSLGEKQEQIHIIPASYDVEAAIQLPGTKILMKAGKKMPVVRQCVKEHHGWAAMVENCGMAEEHLWINAEDMPEHPGYYTLVIVKDRKDEEE